MRAGKRRWTQTVEQVLREPPHRLATHAWTWTDDRSKRMLVIVTDRRFTVDGDSTRVDVTVKTRLERPLRHPLQALRNWLYRGAAQREFEHQLSLIAKRIETDTAATDASPARPS